MSKFKKISSLTMPEYVELKYSGMFWEWYPEATGNYNEDKVLSNEGKFEIEK